MEEKLVPTPNDRQREEAERIESVVEKIRVKLEKHNKSVLDSVADLIRNALRDSASRTEGEPCDTFKMEGECDCPTKHRPKPQPEAGGGKCRDCGKAKTDDANDWFVAALVSPRVWLCPECMNKPQPEAGGGKDCRHCGVRLRGGDITWCADCRANGTYDPPDSCDSKGHDKAAEPPFDYTRSGPANPTAPFSDAEARKKIIRLIEEAREYARNTGGHSPAMIFADEVEAALMKGDAEEAGP